MLAIALGCGQQTSTPEGGEGSGAAQPAEEDGYDIAVIPKGLGHQFWLTVKAGAEAAAGEMNATVTWNGPSSETEVAKQIGIIEDTISNRVDAIVMAACHEEALNDVLKRAVEKGITVVTIDSGVTSDVAVSFVATDNVAGAEQVGLTLAKLIGGAGEVGLIPFISGASTSDMREEGFKKAIESCPDVNLVATLYSQSKVATGMAATEDMLTSSPNIKGIFAANEPGVIGAIQALKARGKAGEVKLVGFDASPEEIRALEEGVIQALAVQNPFKMG
ncbi:MAG: ABC transporter substrate-binding protein, partial [bacterium]|nr:ABC transporter substrate-binding protein [bacterium]